MKKLILILLLVSINCNSTKQFEKIEKLDLSLEKKYIEDSYDIPEYQKQYIIDTFEKSESFCNNCALVVHQLHEEIDSLKKKNLVLDEQAKIYRTARNFLIGSFVLALLFYFRNGIFSLIKLVFRI